MKVSSHGFRGAKYGSVLVDGPRYPSRSHSGGSGRCGRTFLRSPLLRKKTTQIGGGESFRPPPSPPGLPILGNLLALGTLPHQTLRKLAAAYGPVMGIKLGFVRMVVVSSFATAQKFLREPVFMDRPGGDISAYLTYGQQKGILNSEYGTNWRESRNLCLSHMLSTRKIQAFRGMRNAEIHRLLHFLKKAAEGTANLSISPKP
ncbi:unnamed protein product [Spirodela intermedia]|uniref:Uncharacterized protein n=1 Tax=Spirodela intermedia TaxID=51605 RepID=A0A7I8J3S1_SPIIN|nr:unnamed protein product [Spirodela intermedia]CAA6664653.1 unnamed protein product [Spirodela intermedia]